MFWNNVDRFVDISRCISGLIMSKALKSAQMNDNRRFKVKGFAITMTDPRRTLEY